MTDTPTPDDPPRSADEKLLHEFDEPELHIHTYCKHCGRQWCVAPNDEECYVLLRLALDRAREGETRRRDALKAAADELERLRGVLLPEFEGKVGEPDAEVLAAARAASKTEEG